MLIGKKMYNKKVCVWGTGKYANILNNQLQMYRTVFKKVWDFDLKSIFMFFIDSDSEKQGEKIFEKEICSPEYFYNQDIDLCVVAMLSRQEIYAQLEQNGKKNYMSSEEFIDLIKSNMLLKRNEILKKLELEKIVQISDTEELVSEIKKEFINYSDIVIRYIAFSVLIDRWAIDRDNCFWLMQRHFEASFIVSAFSWYFGNDICEISKWYTDRSISYIKCEGKPTIGMVIYNFYGGGIEKVVSLLIPMFLKHGHKVVLITDSLEQNKEFGVPKECIRYVMQSKMGQSGEERTAELMQCCNDFEIDIMCFHSGYTYISTFYEMWGLKLMGIPVVMEIHSFFFPIISEKREVSRYYADMYRMADRIVVLSETDRIFWESLDCNCVYIPNPLEYGNEYIKQVQEIETNRNGCTIVWVGRLVQLPKRVLDVVPIMQNIIGKVPKAKLKLVGLATNKNDLRRLKRLIADNRLEEVIEICGYKSDINDIYKNADVVLLTSESESFCNVIMESKIWGVPLVLYDLPWLELLKDRKGYIAVEPRNVKAIAETIVLLLQDNIKREKLGKEAQNSIKEFMKYDIYNDWNTLFKSIYELKEKKIEKNDNYSIIVKKLTAVFFNK